MKALNKQNLIKLTALIIFCMTPQPAYSLDLASAASSNRNPVANALFKFIEVFDPTYKNLRRDTRTRSEYFIDYEKTCSTHCEKLIESFYSSVEQKNTQAFLKSLSVLAYHYPAKALDHYAQLHDNYLGSHFYKLSSNDNERLAVIEKTFGWLLLASKKRVEAHLKTLDWNAHNGFLGEPGKINSQNDIIKRLTQNWESRQGRLRNIAKTAHLPLSKLDKATQEAIKDKHTDQLGKLAALISGPSFLLFSHHSADVGYSRSNGQNFLAFSHLGNSLVDNKGYVIEERLPIISPKIEGQASSFIKNELSKKPDFNKCHNRLSYKGALALLAIVDKESNSLFAKEKYEVLLNHISCVQKASIKGFESEKQVEHIAKTGEGSAHIADAVKVGTPVYNRKDELKRLNSAAINASLVEIFEGLKAAYSTTIKVATLKGSKDIESYNKAIKQLQKDIDQLKLK